MAIIENLIKEVVRRYFFTKIFIPIRKKRYREPFGDALIHRCFLLKAVKMPLRGSYSNGLYAFVSKNP
jgi:hypothetical protein